MRALIAVVLLAACSVGGSAQSRELQVGDPAPDFKLKATDGKRYRLSSFKGKKPVLLAWIPRRVATDGTSLYGCNPSVECGSLTNSSIRDYDVAFFMAAVVPSLNGDIVGGRRLNPDLKIGLLTGGFPLLRDPTERTATAYGVLTPGIGVTNRWTFYIDNHGTIVFIDKTVGAYTSGWDIVARLDALRFPRLSAEKIAERLNAEKKAEEIRQEEARRTREWEEECRRRPRWCRDDSGSR